MFVFSKVDDTICKSFQCEAFIYFKLFQNVAKLIGLIWLNGNFAESRKSGPLVCASQAFSGD
jgi:hypothetical protein